MKMHMLAAADALPDEDLLAHLDTLAGRERSATAELVAHLATLDSRPALYAGRGYGSLFSYCTEALHLSEDAACNRIAVAKACRRFPVILDLLAFGSMTLTSVRMLAGRLTPENHEGVLERAKGLTKPEVEALVAELAPRPDAPTSVRKLPTPAPSASLAPPSLFAAAADGVTSEPVAASEAPAPIVRPTARPVVQTTAPDRYRVQFTMSSEMHARLRRMQTLLRRDIRDGDPAVIFDRALKLLEADVVRKKLGAAVRPRSKPSVPPRPSVRSKAPIRPGTDKGVPPAGASRTVPREVKRAVFARDGEQCAFVAPGGRRCTERTFLEFHHVQPYARGGPATVANISLRCRRHNQYEADLVFGRQSASVTTTSRPRLESMPAPIGATGMGRQDAKNLSVDHGHASAAPRPPSVSVSSSPCVAITAAKRRPVRIAGSPRHRATIAHKSPKAAATASECEAPR